MPLTVDGISIDVERPRELHVAVAHQRSLFEQHLHRLLHEERIALGALDNQSLERLELRRVAQHRGQHLRRAFLAQRIEPQSACSRSCCPSCGDTRAGSSPASESARCRSSRPAGCSSACVSASIQCRSSKITISGWLRLSRSDEPLDRLAACAAAESAHPSARGAIVAFDGIRAARTDSGSVSSSARSSVSTLPVTFSRRVRLSSSGGDPKIGVEQVDQRQIRRRLAVRDRERLEHQAFRSAERDLELVEQA